MLDAIPWASVDRHLAALNRLVQRLLDSLAGDEHHVERADQVLAQRVAQLGDSLGRDVGGLGRRLGGGFGASCAAVLRARCWRPRAWPPFRAAAVRLADDRVLFALAAAGEALRLRAAPPLFFALVVFLAGLVFLAVLLRRSAITRTSLWVAVDYGSPNRASTGA